MNSNKNEKIEKINIVKNKDYYMLDILIKDGRVIKEYYTKSQLTIPTFEKELYLAFFATDKIFINMERARFCKSKESAIFDLLQKTFKKMTTTTPINNITFPMNFYSYPQFVLKHYSNFMKKLSDELIVVRIDAIIENPENHVIDEDEDYIFLGLQDFYHEFSKESIIINSIDFSIEKDEKISSNVLNIKSIEFDSHKLEE